VADLSESLQAFVTYVKTHLKGDEKCESAYAMPKGAVILTFLLALNQTCAAKEAAGEPITPPGLPLPVEEHAAFVTGDCIRA
jgi:hypothetical protein